MLLLDYEYVFILKVLQINQSTDTVRYTARRTRVQWHRAMVSRDFTIPEKYYDIFMHDAFQCKRNMYNYMVAVASSLRQRRKVFTELSLVKIN